MIAFNLFLETDTSFSGKRAVSADLWNSRYGAGGSAHQLHLGPVSFGLDQPGPRGHRCVLPVHHGPPKTKPGPETVLRGERLLGHPEADAGAPVGQILPKVLGHYRRKGRKRLAESISISVTKKIAKYL